jgi:large subunit ribosomal protein L18e
MSKTQLKSRSRRKTNPSLKDTLALALKNEPWHTLSKKLSGPTRQQAALNLDQIDAKSEAGDTILVPGKILSQGTLTKKLALVALSISSAAAEKLKESKSTFHTIKEEIEKNNKADGVKVL